MVTVMKKVSEQYVENAKIARATMPNAVVLDVTNVGAMKKLDPSFPIGEIDIPGIPGRQGLSLSGIWEGLKIFTKKNVIDKKWWLDIKKVGQMRASKCYGQLEGIKIGEEIVDIDQAKELFQKMYKDLINNKFPEIIAGLRKETRPIVLLDYATEDNKGFLDHANLLKEMIESAAA